MARSKAVANLSVSLTARTTGFARGLKRAQANLRSFAGAAAVTARRIATTTGVMAAGFAGLASVGIGKTITAIDSLQKVSKKLGIPVLQLQALRKAADQSGVPIQTLDMGLQRMVRRVSEAAKGTGEAKDAIAELGLDASKLSRMSPGEQFATIADAMGNIGDQGDKVRLAFKLFDSEGVALINTLETLRDLGGDQGINTASQFSEPNPRAIAGLNKLIAEVRRAEQDFTATEGKGVERAVDAFTKLKDAIAGVFIQVTTKLAPSLESIAKKFESFLIDNKIADRIASAVQEAIDFLGGPEIGSLMDSVKNLGASLVSLLPERWFAALTKAAADAIRDLANFIGSAEFRAFIDKTTKLVQLALQLSQRFAKDPAGFGSAVANGMIDTVPGARGAVNAANRLAEARQFWIDNVAENLLTSANLTGSAARGLDAAGNAVGLGPIGTDILQALRKIERNTADFVSGAVAQ